MWILCGRCESWASAAKIANSRAYTNIPESDQQLKLYIVDGGGVLLYGVRFRIKQNGKMCTRELSVVCIICCRARRDGGLCMRGTSSSSHGWQILWGVPIRYARDCYLQMCECVPLLFHRFVSDVRTSTRALSNSNMCGKCVGFAVAARAALHLVQLIGRGKMAHAAIWFVLLLHRIIYILVYIFKDDNEGLLESRVDREHSLIGLVGCARRPRRKW